MASPTDLRLRPTGTRRWAAACAAVVATVALGGCGSSAGDTSGSEVATTFDADSWTDVLTAAGDASEGMVRPEKVSTTRDGQQHIVQGVSADGDLWVSRSTGQREGSLGTPRVGRLSASGFAPLDYDPAPSRGHQVTAVDHEGDEVVWVETTSTDPGLFDWTVWASSGQGRREVDSSARLGPDDKQPRVFGMTEPVLSGSNIFWAADTSGGKSPRASVLGDPAAGSPATRPVEGAGLPAVTGTTLYYVRSPRTDPDGGPVTTVVARDLGSGKERTVARAALGSSRLVTRLVASGDRVAWVVSDPAAGLSELFVKDMASGKTQGIRMNHPGLQTMSLGLSDRLLVWGNGSSEGDSGQYVLDLTDGSTWRLADQPGYSVVFVDGSTLAWADLPDDVRGTADFEVSRWEGAGS